MGVVPQIHLLVIWLIWYPLPVLQIPARGGHGPGHVAGAARRHHPGPVMCGAADELQKGEEQLDLAC